MTPCSGIDLHAYIHIIGVIDDKDKRLLVIWLDNFFELSIIRKWSDNHPNKPRFAKDGRLDRKHNLLQGD
jgi:hypothetical protein